MSIDDNHVITPAAVSFEGIQPAQNTPAPTSSAEEPHPLAGINTAQNTPAPTSEETPAVATLGAGSALTPTPEPVALTPNTPAPPSSVEDTPSYVAGLGAGPAPSTQETHPPVSGESPETRDPINIPSIISNNRRRHVPP